MSLFKWREAKKNKNPPDMSFGHRTNPNTGVSMEKIACWIMGHKESEAKVKIVDGELQEPRGKPRTINMKIVTVSCSRCGHTMNLIPMGIVNDPGREE